MVTFTEVINYSISGELANFNVLGEFYLTNTSGNNADKAFEIGHLLAPNATNISLQTNGTQIGTYVDAGGVSWSVAANGTFITFMRLDQSTVLSVTIDKRAVLLYLKSKSVIAGSEWVNGCALGAEPYQGIGGMQIYNWKVSLN